jgi:hypothetical protein
MVGTQLQPICQLVDAITLTAARQATIHVERKDSRRESKHEDDHGRDTHLPPVLSNVVH